MRQVWKRQQQLVSLSFSRRQFRFEFLDSSAASFVRRKDRARILASLLRSSHQLAGFVLFSLQSFNFRQETTTRGFESGERCEIRGGVKTATSQPGLHNVRFLSD